MLDEMVNQVDIPSQLLGAQEKQLLGLNALLWEHVVHWVLVEAVDELNKVLVQETELLTHCNLESLERLRHKHLLVVLGGQREDVDDDTPAWLDVSCLSLADVGDAHDDELLDLRSRVQVVEHDLIEWLQEILLEVEAGEFLSDEELVGQLSQGVNGEDGDYNVGMGANLDEMLAQHLPNLGPYKSDTGHVKISNEDEGLQTKLSRVNRVFELICRDFTKILNEAYDSVLV